MKEFICLQGPDVGGKQYNEQFGQIFQKSVILVEMPDQFVDMMKVSCGADLSNKYACDAGAYDNGVLFDLLVVFIQKIEFKDGNEDGKDGNIGVHFLEEKYFD